MPPAAVTHQPGPGRAPAPPHLPLPCIPPHPTRCPGDGLPASSSPRRGMGPARLRQQPSPLLNNRVLSWRGPPSPAWAEHSCPRPPAPAPRHGRFLRVPAWHPPPQQHPTPTAGTGRRRPSAVPRAGAWCQSGSSFAACRGGSRGSGDPGSPSEAVGSSPGDKRPPPDPAAFPAEAGAAAAGSVSPRGRGWAR